MADPKDLGYRPGPTEQTRKQQADAAEEKAQATRKKDELEKQKRVKEEEIAGITPEAETDEEQIKELIEKIDLMIGECDAIIERADAVLETIFPTFSMAGYYSNDDYPVLNSNVRDIFGTPGNISTGVVDKDGMELTPGLMECIVDIATYAKEKPSTDDLANPEGLKEELSKIFPSKFNLFPRLLIELFLMFLKLTVKFFLSPMCKFFGKLPFGIGPEIRKAIQKVGNYIFEKIYDLKVLVLEQAKEPPPPPFQEEDICSKVVLDELEEPQFTVEAAIAEMKGGKGGCDQCQDNCKPTVEQIEGAKAAVKELIRLQNSDKKNTSADVSIITQLMQLKGQTVEIKATVGGLEVDVLPGGRHVPYVIGDAGRRNILAFLEVLEERLKGIDILISNAVNLEFLSVGQKEFLCCVVRLLFLEFVEFDLVGKDVEDYLKKGWKYKDLRPNKRTIAYLKMLEVILSYFLAQAQYNILIQLPLLSLDFFMAAVKKAIAEVLTVASQGIFEPITTSFNEWLKDPTFKQAVELCAPLDWMINFILCGFNNLQIKVFDFLAKLWIEGNETIKSYDSHMSLTLRTRNLKIFSNIIDFILRNTEALRTFCDVDKLSSPQETKTMIRLLVDSLSTDMHEAPPAPGEVIDAADTDDNEARERAKKVFTPVMDPDRVLGPDPDSFINSQLGRGMNGEFAELNVAESPMYVGPEVMEKRMAVEVPITDMKSATLSSIMGCGNELKEMLQTNTSAWKELKKKNTISHLKL